MQWLGKNLIFKKRICCMTTFLRFICYKAYSYLSKAVQTRERRIQRCLDHTYVESVTLAWLCYSGSLIVNPGCSFLHTGHIFNIFESMPYYICSRNHHGAKAETMRNFTILHSLILFKFVTVVCITNGLLCIFVWLYHLKDSFKPGEDSMTPTCLSLITYFSATR